MKTTQRIIGALALVAALAGVAACGPEDDTAGDSSSSSQPAKPSGKENAGGGSTDNADGPDLDCGQPPKLPAGHKVVEIVSPPSKGSMSARDGKPKCTPNAWIYHGQGKAKYYLFAAGEVKAELATGSGSTKSVPAGELWTHAGDCLAGQDTEAPYSCSGNIYDITLDSEGKVKEIKEIWHP
jgi:hypothetical protein